MTDDRTKQEPLFSARYGYVAKALQFECVSEELSNKLWFSMQKVLADLTVEEAKHLWVFGLGINVNQGDSPFRPGPRCFVRIAVFQDQIEQRTRRARWWTLFDFIEYCYLIKGLPPRNETQSKQLLEHINNTLKTECSPHLLSHDKFTPITDEVELNAIAEALEHSDTATDHLPEAFSLQSKRPTPD